MPVEGERELEEFLSGSGALSAEPEAPPAVETGEVVHDAPPDEQPPPEDGAETPPRSPAEAVARAEEEKPDEEKPDEGEEDQEPHVAWATKKYGTDPGRWAKAAYDQERFISSLAEEKRQAEQAAAQAIEYARQVESSAATSTGMPMTAQQEAWVEQSMANPVGYAYQAAMAGETQLYNAVIERVAEVDPGMAANVGTQVQLAMHQERQRLEAEHASRNGSTSSNFNEDMGQSFQRLGIDVQRYGQEMWEKIEELGEYHPYTLAILGGDAIQRDLALQAVYDRVRDGKTTVSRVADEAREEQIRREGELRRGAAGVVTGSPHVPPPQENAFMAAMEEEWRRRGQWPEEEK